MTRYRLNNIKLPLEAGAEEVWAQTVQRVGSSALRNFRVAKKSLDARRKDNLFWVYAAEFEYDGALETGGDLLELAPEERLDFTAVCRSDGAAGMNLTAGINLTGGMNLPGGMKLPGGTGIRAAGDGLRPVVAGSGPAGMMAALCLAEAGLRPIVLERGAAVRERQKAVQKFWATGELAPETNVQFGEGGAGTFSDGKLMTGIKKDMYTAEVFRELTAAGAPEEILYLAKPHLGTDRLAQIVQNIRAEIVSLGGEYRFQNRLEDLLADDDGLKAVKIRDAGGSVYEEPVSALVLAIGHSARDTFEMLFRRGVPMTSKAFSVGVRIEHPQSLIDRAVYHDFAGHPKLGAADYKLAVHLPDGRSAYTFCMCPGGVVVPAASEEGRVVTNGMSYYARDRENANSALLVGVGPENFGSDHPLSGMYWQRRLEENAFRAGGSTYAAPAQRVEDLLKGRPSVKGGEVVPSYARGVVWGGFEHVLPAFVTETLRLSIAEMDRKLHGFNFPDAVMTGVETRSSSPIRILRGDSLQSPLTGLYPCGEGAGYAGGIVSAAADGIRVALAVLQKHAE